MKTLYIEAESFRGNTINSANNIPDRTYGLEHVEDINTHKVYTIYFVGDKVYSVEEEIK